MNLGCRHVLSVLRQLVQLLVQLLLKTIDQTVGRGGAQAQHDLVAKDDWRGFIALVMPMSSELIDPSVVETHRIDSVLTTPFGEPAHMVAKTETAAAFVTAGCAALTRLRNAA
ncbi:hypothetical protein [Synechococcus sp. CBW1006]|uniref:hypothetical protein n=1 Tax=Synechococcus sp. CBW1006 TaxID=1353138 RepID=UPI001E435C0E|nr:hypothetical protein [Synechococcus sp. CBW1006]